MSGITRQRIGEQLRALGVQLGDTVMMYSSLSALGWVDGGVEAVVGGLQDAIGPDGTVLVPAFRNSVWSDPTDFAITDCCPCPQVLCPSKQPGFQGVIAETIRKLLGSLRSCHPTHSWVAVGPSAERLLKGHRNSLTPCGKGNPFEQLVALDGCILLLGVQVNTVTLWHYYEEIIQTPYLGHYWPEQRSLNHCVSGLRIQYQYPGIMQDVCRASGILTTAPVGKSISGLMRARQFDSFMATIMADDPYCLVLRPPNRHCDDLALDALIKAQAMLQTWRRGVRRPEKALGWVPEPIRLPGPNDLVRQDCPAFAGFHDAQEMSVPTCRANGRHPDLFRLGGDFSKHGPTTCKRCSWHLKYPKNTS